MELQEAITTIRALADGLNPITHEALDTTDTCRQPQSVKALNRALAALLAQQDREKNSPGNAGRSWSRAEDQQVCEELRQGKDINEMAKAHNRTVPAIAARLVKLGKVALPKGKPGPLFPEKVA
ncbi:MAG TPA: hypothetical protein VKR57_07240 [Terriglobales bacterium]|nr:hypothetical protein [Terriglobales bacterium]